MGSYGFPNKEMVGEYRFLRSNGGMSFAAVRVESRPHKSWLIEWRSSLDLPKKLYSSAVQAGLEFAAAEHSRRGGQPQRVEVLSLAEIAVATRADVVTCAAALAGWKSWGHDESDACVVFDEGEWKVVFPPAPLQQ